MAESLTAFEPTFALTFDTELIWGSFDHTSPDEFARRYPDIRRAITRILGLLEQYQIPATWAIVGHLYLDACSRDANGVAHPELTRPGQSWRPGDWYAHDPCTSRERDPLWYGPDVVDAIMGCRTPQEIGCHSFSHILYGDPELSREAVADDLKACLELARDRGLTLRSFVFPRNAEGHHDVLAAHGFTAYRGRDPVHYAQLPGPLARVGHLASHLLGTTPPVSQPSETLPGLWNIPGSGLFMHRSGVRRLIGRPARLRRSGAGMRSARRAQAVYHLWTHPFNIASDADYLIPVLDATLREAADLRERGELRIESMAAIADRAAATGLGPARS